MTAGCMGNDKVVMVRSLPCFTGTEVICVVGEDRHLLVPQNNSRHDACPKALSLFEFWGMVAIKNLLANDFARARRLGNREIKP
jgi:hypothetical protein